MKHLDIKEGEYRSKTAKSYYWPMPFGFQMYDPYNTGPISEPMLSPVGPPVAPRRNPYIPKPTNPMTNPYISQMRHNMWPMMPPPRSSGGMPPPRRGSMGIPPLGAPPRRGPMNPYSPYRPSGPPMPPGGYMGPPPMNPAPLGAPPMGPPPMGPPLIRY